MLERFTAQAHQAIVRAQEEARTLKHHHVGTEHILLGLLGEENGPGPRLLEGLGMTLERIRGQVVRIDGVGKGQGFGQIPFSPRAKKVLELASREALRLGHEDVGPEHLLLGLVHAKEGVAARILFDFDADAEKVGDEIVRMLSGRQGK